MTEECCERRTFCHFALRDIFNKIIRFELKNGRKIKFLPARSGERYASELTNMNLSNKVYKLFGSINLKNYILFLLISLNVM